MIVIKVAKTREDLCEVFKLRYRVYVEQDGRFDPDSFPDKMMHDEFDQDIEKTMNLIAYKNGVSVGTIRCAQDSEKLGLPLDEYYDTSEIRKKRKFDTPLYTFGMLAVDEKFRRSKVLLLDLLKFMFALGVNHGLRDAVATINHEIEPLINRLGFRRIGDKFYSKVIRNWIAPVYASEGDFTAILTEGVLPPEYTLFAESSQRIVLDRGEVLFKEDEAGDRAFFIKRGSVSVLKEQEGLQYKISTIGRGSLVGEMALFEDGAKRSATIKANTVTALTVLSEEELFRVSENRQKGLILLRELFDRINMLNQCMISGVPFNACGREDSLVALPEKFLNIVKKLEFKEFKQGDVICKEGEIGEEAYLIAEGGVEVWKQIDGTDTKLAELKQHSIVGEMAPLAGEFRSASIKASSPKTTLRVLPESDLHIALSDPQIIKYLFSILCQRIRRMNEQLTAADMRRKIACDLKDLLLTMHHEMMLSDFFDREDLEINNIEWVAQNIGVTEEEVLPFIKQLIKAKVIKKEDDGNVKVLNEKGLQNFVFEIELSDAEY